MPNFKGPVLGCLVYLMALQPLMAEEPTNPLMQITSLTYSRVGSHRVETRIYADGTVKEVSKITHVRTGAGTEQAEMTVSSGRLTKPQLSSLKRFIDDTAFDTIKLNRNAIRPSAGDGVDTTADFYKDGRKTSINLWELESRDKLQPLKLWDELKPSVKLTGQ